MIWLYEGTPGSGKSYHALKTALEYYGRRRTVVANFPVTKVDPQRWHYIENPQVPELVELARKWRRREGEALLVIDEAARQFNSRDWVKGENRPQWITFFSQHRKLGYDVVLVAQSERMLDRQIRANVELLVKHHSASHLFPLSLIDGIVPLHIFIVVTFWAHTKFKGHVRAMVLNPFVARRYDHLRIFRDLGRPHDLGWIPADEPAAAPPAEGVPGTGGAPTPAPHAGVVLPGDQLQSAIAAWNFALEHQVLPAEAVKGRVAPQGSLDGRTLTPSLENGWAPPSTGENRFS